MTNEDLLQPVLSDRSDKPIFSVGALMAAAFLGGGFAVFIVGMANVYRLHGPLVHYLYLTACVVAFGAGLFWMGSELGDEGMTNIRLANRVGGFALMGLLYLLHRRTYRSMNALAIDPPRPYVIVTGACIAGLLAIGSLLTMTGQFNE